MKNKSLGIGYALLCVGLWSLIPVVSRFGQTTLNNIQFLWWSNILSFIVVAIPVVTMKRLPHLTKWQPIYILKLLGLGAIGCAFYYLCLYYGYAKGQGMEVLILQYTWPIFIVVLSGFLLKERLGLKIAASCALGLLGIVLVLTKGRLNDIPLGNLSVNIIVLIGAFSFALFSVLSKKIQTDIYLCTAIYFLGGIALSTLVLLGMSDFMLPSKAELLPVIINGAFINGVSYIFWLKALDNIPASLAAGLVFLTPIFSTLWIMLFFQEPFHFIYLAGLLLVIAAGFFAQKSH